MALLSSTHGSKVTVLIGMDKLAEGKRAWRVVGERFSRTRSEVIHVSLFTFCWSHTWSY